jgi:hypothetical protein
MVFFFNPSTCYKKYFVIEKFEKKKCDTCFFKCKYPPPSKPIPIEELHRRFVNNRNLLKIR